MSSRILKSGYQGVFYKPNLTAVPTDLRYDPENGNVELVQQGPGGQVLYKNGEFTDAGNAALQENESRDALEESVINDVKSAATTVDGELQPWVDALPEQEPLNSGPVDQPNDLFNVTAKDFQEDTPIKAEYLIYPASSNTSQNRINITQRRYVASGQDNLFNPRFNEPATRTDTNGTKAEFLGTVVLPMPNNISEANSTGWGENSLSTFASQVMTGALKVVTPTAAGKILEGGEEFKKVVTGLTNDGTKEYMKQLLTLNAAASVTKFLGINIDPEAYRSRATGTVINPNLELLFNGPKLRSFGFEFKMIPRTSSEAKNIRYILKFFKKGMAAKRGTTGEGYFLGTPNVFDIEFKGSENTIGKIKTCALQTFNVNYTPDGVYAAFNDSQPISVVMQLGFTELTPIYNDDYNENTDSVGWDEKV